MSRASVRLRRDGIALAVDRGVYLGVSAFVSNSYYQLILTLVPIWAVFGVSWNILSGYGGQLSFGHASFFGIGAYTVTLALVYWDLTPWLGIPLGMLVGAVAAVLIGTPTFRLRGHYFALAMLAYPLAILYVLQYLGFQEMSLPMHREHPAAYLAVHRPASRTPASRSACWSPALVVCMLVENSRFGLALLAIRQNELAAEAAGINARRWKMRALVVSGMIAAAAGGLYACVLLVVTPDSVFGMLVSAQAVVVTLFGGVAAIVGAGDRRRDPGAAGGITECGAGQHPARHPGRGVRRRDHRHHAGGAGGSVLDDPRPLVPPRPAAAAAGAAALPPSPCPRRMPRMATAAAGGARTCRARSAACAPSAR